MLGLVLGGGRLVGGVDWGEGKGERGRGEEGERGRGEGRSGRRGEGRGRKGEHTSPSFIRIMLTLMRL